MSGVSPDHDVMSFQWDHDGTDPKAHELWEALQYESALAAARTEHTSDSTRTSSPQQSRPMESTSSATITLDDILAQKRSRSRTTAVSSTRSSSTIRPQWYRRWHTQNTGTMFTVGPSSSESDMSEVEENGAIADGVNVTAEMLLEEQAQSPGSPPYGPEHDSELSHPIDVQFHSAVGISPPERSDSRADAFQCIQFEAGPSTRQPLSTVTEEDISEPTHYALHVEPLPVGDALLDFALQEDNAAPDARPHHDETGQLRSQQTKHNRLAAELQLQMTDSRLDDSDGSWTEADDQQEWYIQLQTQLATFRKQSSRLSLITSLLGTPQRKQVHAMAKMMGLSHLSLGKGKLKRLLLTKCELAQTFGCMPPNKRWTSHRQHWVGGWADPRLLIVENICWDVPQADIQSHITNSLTSRHVSNPYQFVTIRQAHVGTYAAYMFFKSPDHAASALLALDNDQPTWNEWPLGCEYVRLPGTSRVIDVHVDLNKLARAANHLWLAEQDCSDLPTLDDLHTYPANTSSMATLSAIHHMPDDLHRHHTEYDQPTLDDDMALAPSSFADSTPMSRIVSSTSTSSEAYSSNIGQPSLGASTSITSFDSLILSDYGSEASVTKKRKRQPTTQAGYKCSSAGCDKSFDRMGDLRKHEKVHSSFRPHMCGFCGQGFLYPKDLRRHQTKKGHVQLGDELARVPEEGGLTRSWSTSAI